MLVWSDNLACRLLLLPGPPHIHAGAISQHRLCLRSFTWVNQEADRRGWWFASAMQNFLFLLWVNQEAGWRETIIPLSKADFFFYLGSEEDANDSPWANQVPKVAPAAAGCLHNCTRRRESATPSFLPSGLRGSRTPTGRMIESIFVCGFQLSPERTGEG